VNAIDTGTPVVDYWARSAILPNLVAIAGAVGTWIVKLADVKMGPWGTSLRLVVRLIPNILYNNMSCYFNTILLILM